MIRRLIVSATGALLLLIGSASAATAGYSWGG